LKINQGFIDIIASSSIDFLIGLSHSKEFLSSEIDSQKRSMISRIERKIDELEKHWRAQTITTIK
jgi:hypothetical protein